MRAIAFEKYSVAKASNFAIALISLPFLSSCLLPQHYNRIRLTAEVTVGKAHYFGSTVQEYICSEGAGTMSLGSCNIEGDAVVVDLKERGYLFLIAQGRSALDRTSLAKGVLASRPDPSAHKWWVRPDAYPVMVRFRDVKDHSTIEVVSAETLPEVLGSDVNFVGIIAEDSNDQVTTGIVDQVLPWIQGYDEITTIQTGSHYMGTGQAYDIQVLDFKARGR